MSQILVTGEAKIRDIQGPVVANSGVITALDGAANQYVRGDGTLADFPTTTGGGSSVSYYLNGSVNQGTIGGVAYKELSKDPILGVGTDFTISANGYVASFITDANDPDSIIVPGGNWNTEIYFSVDSNSNSPYFYVEVYKYDGSTFTLLGSNQTTPEYITAGTTITPYYGAVAIPTTNTLITDRIAIRIYVVPDGRTVTLHTENSHLGQIVTTFSKGLTSLNNLTDQSQYLTTGTSGTDFNIVSSGDTHTFNIPSASASNRGLITTGAQTIAGIKTLSVPSQFEQGLYLKQNMNLFQAGYIGLGASTTGLIVGLSGGGFGTLNFNNTTSFTYTFPNATGTLALTSDLSSYVPYTGATGSVNLGLNNLTANNVFGETSLNVKILPSGSVFSTGYSVLSSLAGKFTIAQEATAGNLKAFTFDFSAWATNTSRTYNLPDASGTLAILEAGTQTFTGTVNVLGSLGTKFGISIEKGNTPSPLSLNDIFIYASSGATNIINFANSLYRTSFSFPTSNQTFTYPAASGTVALTSDLSSYVPYTGATTNVDLGVRNLSSFGINVNGDGTGGGALNLKNYNSISHAGVGYTSIFAQSSDRVVFNLNDALGTKYVAFLFGNLGWNSQRYYGLPNADGTLALTSDLSAYLPLTGGTLTGALSGTSATFSGTVEAPLFFANAGGSLFLQSASDAISIRQNSTSNNLTIRFNRSGVDLWKIQTVPNGANEDFKIFNSQNSTNSLTIASTGAATFSSSVTAAGVTIGDSDVRSSSNVLTLGGTSEVVRITGGNVGIGTSSPVAADSSSVTLQLRNTLILQNVVGTQGLFSNNAYYDGSSWKRVTTLGSAAVRMNADTGQYGISFHVATSGSAGSTITNWDSSDLKMRINENGNVLIGTTTDSSGVRLKVAGGIIGCLDVYNNTTGVGANVNIDANGFFARSTSSLKYKKNINNLTKGLNEVLQLRPVTYNSINETETQTYAGLIAEEVHEIGLTEFVQYAEDGTPDALSYGNMVSLLVKAIQELTQKVNELESKNK